MSDGRNQSLIERIISIEAAEHFPDRKRDAFTVEVLSGPDENGQVHYQFTVTRKGTIAATDGPN